MKTARGRRDASPTAFSARSARFTARGRKLTKNAARARARDRAHEAVGVGPGLERAAAAERRRQREAAVGCRRRPTSRRRMSSPPAGPAASGHAGEEAVVDGLGLRVAREERGERQHRDPVEPGPVDDEAARHCRLAREPRARLGRQVVEVQEHRAGVEDGPLGGEAGVADGTDDEVDVAARVAHGLRAVEVDEAEVAGTLGAATGADDAPPLARERTREERAEEALRAEHEHAARVVSVEVEHRGFALYDTLV